MNGQGGVAVEGSEGVDREPHSKADAAREKDECEFQITVRKLELPVRPRGVLAE